MNNPKSFYYRSLAWASFCLTVGLAHAGNLYEWTDGSGQTRFGYRPPPGIVGASVGEEALQLRQSASASNCKELEQQHLQLIDAEIARVRNLPAGRGPSFEFTAESKQKFINDLLAHRAAFISGRPPEIFAAPDKTRELRDLEQKYRMDTQRMEDDLETQARQIQLQRVELERERGSVMWMMYRFPYIYPFPGLIFH